MNSVFCVAATLRCYLWAGQWSSHSSKPKWADLPCWWASERFWPLFLFLCHPPDTAHLLANFANITVDFILFYSSIKSSPHRCGQLRSKWNSACDVVFFFKRPTANTSLLPLFPSPPPSFAPEQQHDAPAIASTITTELAKAHDDLCPSGWSRKDLDFPSVGFCAISVNFLVRSFVIFFPSIFCSFRFWTPQGQWCFIFRAFFWALRSMFLNGKNRASSGFCREDYLFWGCLLNEGSREFVFCGCLEIKLSPLRLFYWKRVSKEASCLNAYKNFSSHLNLWTKQLNWCVGTPLK